MKKVIIRLVALAVLVAAGWGGYRFFQQLPARQEQLPTTKVQRGDVVIRAYSRGELRAVRSVTLIAPNLFGTVQTTALAPVGSLAKEKDLVVEYDDSERKAALEEAQLAVQSVDEQIKKAKADLAIQQSQDGVTLLKTRYDVRRAELEVQRNPIISVIDAKKNQLTLEQTKRALLQLESDIQSRKEQADSQLAVLTENRNRSLLDVQRELQRIAQTKALAPITGLVSIKQNRAGNFFNFGQQMPDIREGDTLQPGMPVADLLDLSELEVWAKVGELDRANLKEGQEAMLQLDAIPDKQFRGKIKAMSGTATSDVFSGDPSKKFDVIFAIDMRQLLSGLGMKPADVDRIMATAEANSKKNVVNTAPSFFSSLQGGAPGDAAGAPGQDNADQGGGGRRRGGGGGPGGGGRGQGGAFGDMSNQDRQKMRELMQQMQTASAADKVKIQQQIQDLVQKPAADPGASQGRGGRRGQGGDQGGGPGGDFAQGRGGRRGQGGDQGGRPGGDRAQGGGRNAAGDRASGGGPDAGDGGGRPGRGGGPAVGDPIQMMMRRASSSQFSEAERNNAKLPLPPGQDSQVQVLLRPGLLADVEITVEKLPDVIHVPAQAVFQKNGKFTVFVENKKKKFEPREVQLVKQSESMMVIASGVQPGEIVALADPTVDRSKNNKGGDKKSQGSPMGGMGGGK